MLMLQETFLKTKFYQNIGFAITINNSTFFIHTVSFTYAMKAVTINTTKINVNQLSFFVITNS